MKSLLIIYLSLFLSFDVLAQQSKQMIPWSEEPLSWDDYKGRPNRASSFEALTAAGIGFDVQYDGELLTFEVINTFDPKSSWTKEKKSAELLAHEQLHFNISELFARKLRKELIEREYKNEGDKLMDEIGKVYKKHIKELDEYQKAYDKETRHSLNKEEQKRWEKKVEAELKKLENYKETQLKIFP